MTNYTIPLAIFTMGLIVGAGLTWVVQQTPYAIAEKVLTPSKVSTDNFTITGIYFPQGVICIRTEGRTDEDINHTISHEWAHYLIDKNKTCGDEGCYEHFCE